MSSSAYLIVCLVVAGALIFSPRAVIMPEMKKLAGGYDNNNPREAQAKLTGRGKRAVGAHQNSWEAFQLFAPAIILCLIRHVDETRALVAAIVFLVARSVYVAAYIGDKATLRSGVWTVGVLATLALYVLALLGS